MKSLTNSNLPPEVCFQQEVSSYAKREFCCRRPEAGGMRGLNSKCSGTRGEGHEYKMADASRICHLDRFFGRRLLLTCEAPPPPQAVPKEVLKKLMRFTSKKKDTRV
ncbi:hypothetical protein PIB30_005751 [Stylosanthes scabra]|uniref:Uncharacterized protein n=1 Tax=Stylosanthes scabra TaxID=79078 RepID=A0ABU6W5A4_9FABA|nr:hypothetical protein [Stylosanthes scabra]